MRPPSSVLIVDTNIVVSSALGFSAGRILEQVGAIRALAISEHAASEIIAVSHHLIRKGHPSAALARDFIDALSVIPEDRYSHLIADAADVMRRAVASQNGSVSDAHLLAAAWLVEADIWSHDRDFAGTGWPSWSSANLASALAQEASPPG